LATEAIAFQKRRDNTLRTGSPGDVMNTSTRESLGIVKPPGDILLCHFNVFLLASPATSFNQALFHVSRSNESHWATQTDPT
jgi:hypothetical protein